MKQRNGTKNNFCNKSKWVALMSQKQERSFPFTNNRYCEQIQGEKSCHARSKIR